MPVTKLTNFKKTNLSSHYWEIKSSDLLSPSHSPLAKSSLWCKVFFFLIFFLLPVFNFGQTTIWYEDFDDAGLVGESVDDGSHTPIGSAWSTNYSGSEIFYVQKNGSNNVFEAEGTITDAEWMTGIIDITGYVDLEVVLELTIDHQLKTEDSISFWYSDGSSDQIFLKRVQPGNAGSETVRIRGISGTTLQFFIRINLNEDYTITFDDVLIQDVPTTRYAIVDGNWEDNTTWSYTSGGAACGCIPDEYSEVYTDLHTVSIHNDDAEARDLTIGGTDQVVFDKNNRSLSLYNGGTLLIEPGGILDFSSNGSSLIFESGENISLINNSSAPGINGKNMVFNNIDSLTISGAGDILVEDITYNKDNIVVTNQMEGSFEISNDMVVDPDLVSNKLINSELGTLTISGDIEFNDNDFYFGNSGIVNLSGDFLGTIGIPEIHNLDGATWNWTGTNYGSILLYASYTENTFNYNLSGDQDIITPEDSYYHLKFSGGGMKIPQDNFQIDGDWIDYTDYDTSNIIITFGGDSNQTITNPSGENFYGLKVNKSGGELILNTDVTVENALTMTSGNINSESNILSLDKNLETSLDYSDGIIIGKFKRAIGIIGSDYSFPVGTSTTLNSFTYTANSSLTNGSLIVEFIDSDPGDAGLPFLDGSDSVYHQFTEGYWSTSGTNGLICNDFDVLLNGNGFSSFTIDSDTRTIIRNNGGDWTTYGTHGTNAGSIVNRQGINSLILTDPATTDFGLGHPVCVFPTIDEQPSDQLNVCPGSDIFFDIQASGGGILSYQWYKDGAILNSDTGGFSGVTSDTLYITGVNSDYVGSYYCIVDNICSKDTMSSVISLKLDTLAPTFVCPGNQVFKGDNSCSHQVSNDDINISSVSDNCTSTGLISISYQLSGATQDTVGTLNGQIFNIDTTLVKVIVTDELLNLDSCSYLVIVKDTINPDIVCQTDTILYLDSSCKQTLPDYTSFLKITDCSSYKIEQYPLSGTIITDTTEVKIKITDAYSNIDSCSFMVNVVDTIKPVITTCLSDTAINLDASCELILPNFRNRLVIDECSAYEITQLPDSGTTITDTIEVTLTVTDEFNNKRSCIFWVNTIDTIKPKITGCASDTTINLDLNCEASIPDFTEDVDFSFDGCLKDTVTQVPEAGEIISDTTPVTLYVTDEFGNYDSCTFIVNVIDTIKPIITTCMSDTTINLDSSCELILPNFRNRLVIDECSAYEITQLPDSGTTIFDTTKITLTVTDEFNNKRSCIFWVNTIDTIKPKVTGCALDTTINLDLSCEASLPDFTKDTDFSFDGCLTDIVTQVPASGEIITDTTQVTLYVTDAFGNYDSCTFMVNAIDTIKPVITTCMSDTTINLDASCELILPNFRNRLVIDECSAYEITQLPDSGTTIQDTTEITLTVKDEFNNKRSCSFKINPHDSISPTTIAVDSLEVEISLTSGIASISVSDIDFGSYDNCTLVDLSIDIDTFYCDDIGNTLPVILTGVDNSGNFSKDTTWVKIPGYDISPEISFTLDSDTLLCSGNLASISFISNADSTSYNWTVSTHADVSGLSDGSVIYPNGGDYNLEGTLVNNGTTARKVEISLTATLFNMCQQTQFDTTISFWVIPGLSVDLMPEADTLCNNDTTALTISSVNNADKLRFKYWYVPDNPDDIDILHSGDTSELSLGYLIADTIVNNSQTYQSILLIAEPYISTGTGSASCSGVSDTAIVLVEPAVSILAKDDTICSEDFTNIMLTSESNPMFGIRYAWEVNDMSGGNITGYSNSSGIGYPMSKRIEQQLVNSGNDSEQVIYTITPYTIRPDSSLHCAGTPIDVSVWVEPVPNIKVNVVTDTIVCDSGNVSFDVDSLTTGVTGTWVYDLTITSTSSPLITGYSNYKDTVGIITNKLINPTSDVQWVEYTFHPHIIKDGVSPSCDPGTANDTTLKIYINPTPRIRVTLTTDSVICDSGSVSFEFDSLLAETTGQWVCSVTTSTSNALVSGFSNIIDTTKGFTDQLYNNSDTVQWVDYTFHPQIKDPYTGMSYCDHGTKWDTTIRIWVEPYPSVEIVPDHDSICSGDTTALQLKSITGAYYGIDFKYITTPSNPDSVDIVHISGTSVLGKGDYIIDRITNLSDTAQTINYAIISYILDKDSNRKCIGDTTYAEVIVEPTIRAELTPEVDTICDNSSLSILLGSASKTSQSLKFSYEIIPENAGAITIGWDTLISGTLALDEGEYIADTLINNTDTAQLVYIVAYPYIHGAAGSGCSGDGDTTEIWVEPTAVIDALSDTICSGGYTNIAVSSESEPTIGIRYMWEVNDLSGGKITGYSNSSGIGYPLTKNIEQQLVNSGTDSVRVVYTITPYTIRADSSLRCAGTPFDVFVWVEPIPNVDPQALNDTICDSTEVIIKLNSLSKATHSIEFGYTVVAEYPDKVSISPGVNYSGLTVNDSIKHLIDNKTDTAQLVQFTIWAYTIDNNGDKHCPGDSIVKDIWVEPTPQVGAQPQYDTICDSSEVRIVLSGITDPTLPVQYKYYIMPTDSEIDLYPSTGYSGLNNYDTIAHFIKNNGDTARFVEFVITPYTIDGNGSPRCYGDSIVSGVWVEPIPKVILNPFGDTICSGDTLRMTLESYSDPTLPVVFEYFTVSEVPSGVDITHVNATSGLVEGDKIEDYIVNNTDSVQTIIYKVVPYAVDGQNYKHCIGDTVITTVIVEPAAKAILLPEIDTICSEENVYIKITSNSQTSHQLKFYYEIVPQNPDSVAIGYDTLINGTVALDTGMVITDALTNLSDSAQLVQFYITAYIDDPSGGGCSGETTIADIWVEPTPIVALKSLSDTICDSTATQIVLESPSVPTRPLEFSYKIRSTDPTKVTVSTSDSTSGYHIGDTIDHFIDNLTDTAQLVQFVVTPYIIDAVGHPHCGGDSVVTDIWIEPTPIVDLIPSADTICDSTEVIIELKSISSPTNPVEFEYIIDPESPLDVELTPVSSSDGLHKNDSIKHCIQNYTETYQIVNFRVVPYTVDSYGNKHCFGDTITSSVWIEPSPRAIAKDDTLCNDGTTEIIVTTNYLTTAGSRFTWVVDADPDIVGASSSDSYGLLMGDTIKQTLHNNSDTARLVRYILTPYALDITGEMRCPSHLTAINIWVEPSIKIEAEDDTICDNSLSNIEVVTTNQTTNGMRYTWTVNAPSDILGVSPSAGQGNSIDDLLDQTLDNISDTARIVQYFITPYIVDANNNNHCSGDPITVTLWVEPTISLTAVGDTICNNETVYIPVSSTNQTTNGMRYTWTVNTHSDIQGASASTGSGQLVGDDIIQTLDNVGDTARLVQYIITPWSIDAKGQNHCDGEIITIDVWVEPTLNIIAQSDTICDSIYTNIEINSINQTTNGMRYTWTVVSASQVTGASASTGDGAIMGTSIEQLLDNVGDTAKLVRYIVTPWIIDINGNNICAGNDITIDIWVEPTINIEAIDDTLCSGEYTQIDVSSINQTTNGIRYTWTVVVPSSVTGADPSTGVGQDISSSITQELINNSDTAQLVQYIITPWSIDAPGTGNQCEGNAITIDVWIEPSLVISVVGDTLCNGDVTNIVVNTNNKTTNGIRFTWTVLAPSDVTGASSSTGLGYALGTDINQTLTNSSDTARLVQYIITPWSISANNTNRCSGKDITVSVYVEPTAMIYFDHYKDTICHSLNFDSILVQSPTSATVGIRFNYEVIPDNPDQVNYTSAYPSSGIEKNARISEQIENNSDTIQRIVVKLTPYLIDGSGNSKCFGDPDSVIIQLTPRLVMLDSARQYPRYQIKCKGDQNGAIYMYPTGGILAFGTSNYDHINLDYEFQGSDARSMPYYEATADYFRVDSLAAGTYNFEASDFSGCLSAGVETLSEADLEFEVEIRESVDILCANNNNGEVYAAKWGGAYYVVDSDTSGYTTTKWTKYSSITNTINKDTLSGVGPGEYIVQVWDTNGCLATDTKWFWGANPPSAEFATFAKEYDGYNITCNGVSDGIIYSRYTLLGDTIRYDFYKIGTDTVVIDSVFDSDQDTLVWSGLDAGKYLFKISSEIGCYTYDSIILTEPEELSLDAYSLSQYHNDTWNVICSDSSNGFIKIDTVSGGRDWNYSYEWLYNGAEIIGTTVIVSDLPSGMYSFILSDGYCYDTSLIEMTAPDSIYIMSRLIDSNLCWGEESATLSYSIAGGEGDTYYWNYQWAHDILNDSTVATGLSSGTYYFTVIDSIGCVLRDTAQVVDPGLLEHTTVLSDYHSFNISCFGGNDGEISVSATGGITPFTYNWTHEASSLPDDSVVTGLDAGIYYMEIVDRNGCSNNDTFNLKEPSQLVITSLELEDMICSTPGIGSVKVSGGVPVNGSTYYYLWSSGDINDYSANLSDGENRVTVTDWNSCTIDSLFTISKISNIDIAIDTQKAISCYNYNDGILEIVSDDANLPFTSIKWNTGATSNTINDVGAGTYTVEIIDSKDCFAADTFELIAPDPVESEIVSYDPRCNGYSDGYIMLDATGGNGGFLYIINDTLQATSIIENIKAGIYHIAISDKKNCTGSDTIIVEEPEVLEIVEEEEERITPRCPDDPYGSITVTAIGGTEPYIFRWVDNEYEGATINNVPEGLYKVNVTDINNCYTEDSIYLEPELPACLVIPTAISPNGDGYNDTWIISNPLNDEIDIPSIYPNLIIKIYNRWGQMIWQSERGYPGSSRWDGTNSAGRELPVDSYHYIIYLNNDSNTVMRGIITIVK